MKKITTVYTVEIWNLTINKFVFEFKYKVSKNDEFLGEGTISSDHSWGDSRKEIESFRKMLLKEGYADELVLNAVLS